MRVLVTGRGTSGSWAIRGQQLGSAIGATVDANAAKCKGYDLAIVVKRAPDDLLHRLRVVGVPIVWDVVDGWPQPAGNSWDKSACTDWLARQFEKIKPAAVVASTKRMREDLKDMGFAVPILTLPHHARTGQAINPIRERVQKVGYEGALHYLGWWHTFMSVECAARGWQFVVNPPALADLDIVIAMRECDRYAPRNYKSNVKLANAQGSKTPIICNREAGYLETATGGEHYADGSVEMVAGLNALTSQEARRKAADGLTAPTLEDVAQRYREWLSQLKS